MSQAGAGKIAKHLWMAVALTALLGPMTQRATAADSVATELQRDFTGKVQPFLTKYCGSCHGADKQEGKLDLSAFSDLDKAVDGHRTWGTVLRRLETAEMPPEEATRQPTADERKVIAEWIRGLRKYAAQRNAGDPGKVPARRLSNAEYDYTIRDLTGVDIRPTRDFPVDPANEAGFDNSGESLAMSPALLKKYLGAARLVSDHLVLKPEGFDFAEHPAVTDTDRDKYCVRRIVAFYQRQPTDYADYFQAAWRYRHRAALGRPNATLDDIAGEAKVSPRYLPRIWSALEDPAEFGPLAKLQKMWRDLPAPSESADAVRAGCEAMRDFVGTQRQKTASKYANLIVRGVQAGSQTMVMWKNLQYATHRRNCNHELLQVEGTVKPVEPAPPPPPDAAARNRGRGPVNKPIEPDADLTIPVDEAERARHVAAFDRFCDVFPDAFFILQRGREYVDRQEPNEAKGRFLSAGFHSMMGYFRDDIPLCELILDDQDRQELDELWRELDFIALAPIRQHSGFLWFEKAESRFMLSAEFDPFRAEDKDAGSETKIRQMAKLYLAKAEANGGSEVALQAISDHFERINAAIRWVEQARAAAEPSHLTALETFAERAFRRPLSAGERDELLTFYRAVRAEDGLSHEEAIRESIVRILMSPRFCYRIDAALAPLPNESKGAIQPLSGYSLASRLSYFLWSSLPDRELLDLAASGELSRPETLVAHARRMLKDEKIRGLAAEFGGNWLDIRRFEEHNSVDRERFPMFTSELRQAMFEEPLHFFVDLVQRDGSVLEFVHGEHTFVNPVLAKHYGMPAPVGGPTDWVRIDDARVYERGGLLPMAVFLTKNSPGLRTSPVKRGYWVVRRLLGEEIPPPPPNVPELPNDESKSGDLTLRELLEKHREHKSCAACHERFDSFGLVFEGFGPVGERRVNDLAGRPVDTRASFPGGGSGTGVAGLREFIRGSRQDDFLDNLCRKMLAYALGRTLIPSDDQAIAEMRSRLSMNGYRFGSLIESIVTSPQFSTRRGSDPVTKD